MTAWIDLIDFPDPWTDLRDADADDSLLASLSAELRQEIPEAGHPLSGIGWAIVASGAPRRDDVLLLLDDGSVAITHLTWKQGREAPPWPSTSVVSSLDQLNEELLDRGYDGHLRHTRIGGVSDMSKRGADCATELQTRCRQSDRFTDADLRFIQDYLGPALTPFTFIAVLREALGLPVELLRSLENWTGASASGDMSRAEVVAIIDQWWRVHRSRSQ